MVNLTFLEIHLDDSSVNLPFGSVENDGAATDDEATDAADDEGAGAEEDDDSGTGKVAVLAVLLVFVALAALVKYLSGDESPEVDVDTDEDSLEVTVDE
jgi:hypothetical protein